MVINGDGGGCDEEGGVLCVCVCTVVVVGSFLLVSEAFWSFDSEFFVQ